MVNKFKLTEIEEVILWARQWDESVDDEDVLKMWNKKIGLVKDYGDLGLRFDLRDFHKKWKKDKKNESRKN